MKAFWELGRNISRTSKSKIQNYLKFNFGTIQKKKAGTQNYRFSQRMDLKPLVNKS
jgi:hypothetical protein